MKFLHTMVRVKNLEESLKFYCDTLGLKEIKRTDYERGQFTLVFLAAPADETVAREQQSPLIELTYNWEPEVYDEGRNFGHLAFEVDNIYATCDFLEKSGVVINRPPRDGYMAFVRSPDNISIELLQKGSALPPLEKWKNAPNIGIW